MTATSGAWLGSAVHGGYRLATILGAPFAHAYLRHRRRIGKEDAARFAERFGVAGASRPAGPLLWLHAVSVGEAMSVLALLDRLRVEYPGLGILVTTTTVTAARALAPRLPPGAIHQFVPADLPGAVERFLDHWRPNLVLFAESEFWPNLLGAVARRGVPLVLVNARISRRFFALHRWARPLMQRLLGLFALVLVQTPDDGDRLRALGARDVRVTGNLKYSAAPLPADAAELAQLRSLVADRPLWLAASTHAGEDEAIAEAHQRLERTHPGLLTVIVPRHPERGPAVAQILAARGLAVARRAAGEPLTRATAVYVADTLGELGLWYRLAGIAFVGGSLVPHGGQNMLEPARLGCAVLCGPHTWNFAAIVAEMRAASALLPVGDAAELANTVAALLANPRRREEAGEAAARYGRDEARVLDRVTAALSPLLDAATGRD